MIDIQGILDILPHRYPFLLVDRVVEIEENRILAIKNVTFNEPHFPGHFPGAPIMPGVLVVEAMAQAGAILLLRQMPDRRDKLVLFTGIDQCRFRRPVVPGDQVLLDLTIKRRRPSFAVMAGIARVDGQVAAEAQLSSSMVDRPKEES